MEDDGSGWPLRTARLTIRPMRPTDVEATWSYRRLPEVAEWITIAPPDRAAYDAMFADSTRLAHTLVVEREGTLVGDLMLRVEDAWSQAEARAQATRVQAELGWCLDPRYGGQGYATEAVRELVRHCFEDLRLRRVTAACFAANEASWRLMERIGMRRETPTRRESLHRSRGWVDGLGYALLADEFRPADR